MEEARVGYRLLLVGFVLLANGFFAAAEVALVSVRQSRLKQLAAEGQTGANAALSLLERPERLLSVVQVGVTLASLGLGWAGQETLYFLFTQWFGSGLAPEFGQLFRSLAFGLAFLLITYAHVVVGEVVPKNIAIEKADRLAVVVAPVLLVFARVATPFVFVIERSAALLSRGLGRKGEPLGGGHSAEELKFILLVSRRRGQVESFEEAAISRLLDLQDYLVREIMVPRSEIVSAPVTASLDEMLSLMAEHKFSRVPVYEGGKEHIIGIVHFKDLVAVWREHRRAAESQRARPQFSLRLLMTKPYVVPETKPLNQLISHFRNVHSHMALVVDEFGTVVGLVTMEDVLEQIFGEIEDEHDVHLPPVVRHAPILELEGGVSIRDLEMHYGIELPVDAGFETLAGFLLHRLGSIPAPGNELEYEGYRFTVLEMERNRIARVRVERLSAAEGTEGGEERS